MKRPQEPSRDYAADMRKYIDEYTADGDYNAADVSHRIVEKLRGEDRELLYGWLEAHAAETIRAAIARRDASTRAYARSHVKSSVFAQAAQAAAGGDYEPLKAGYLQAIYVVDGLNTRKALKDMTSSDVLFVASTYTRRARTALMEAAFLKAVAKQIGDRHVGDVFNNEQLAELYNSIS